MIDSCAQVKHWTMVDPNPVSALLLYRIWTL